MRVSIIAALSTNRTIGFNNRIPWHLPEDLKRFKRLTMGHHLLMGRRTFESIGRVLPGRTTVVITRRKNYSPVGVLVGTSLKEALELAGSDEEVFIAGGGQIYREALIRADRLYLTLVHGEFSGDVHFPSYDDSGWRLLSREDYNQSDINPYRYSFLVLEKTPSPSLVWSRSSSQISPETGVIGSCRDPNQKPTEIGNLKKDYPK